MKNKAVGESAFDEYYSNIYGERWRPLLDGLYGEPRYTTISHVDLPEYRLDDASRIAALTLGSTPGMQIADLCAAPGGKTLIIAGEMDGQGSLIANERSRQRRERLKRVISEHLPENFRKSISVTGHDASRWCLYETDAFDAALLDVPCSAERHLLGRPTELARWTPSRTKRLAAQSYAMLASTLEIVHIGGTILFSTCSISPIENDLVIDRLLSRRTGRFEIVNLDKSPGEMTDHGRILLPDIADGRGPLYFALIRRTG